ncbi:MULTISPECIES: hypothetical protein [unclassified Paenibacillus]|uniref:hypothetical protein n=1 Tax=unclassified Paenibacillus TaxID=185978 RepID=UPI001046E2F6|nr:MULTISPECIES: hypothetical protein [unclassified Paenibacillus]NIK69672.1 maltodextrin utilization protein YvdJ [Paenibacillus sp. BK720]TCM95848.1 hypothetical protein EV294_106219 [Paenibacillus sp. BK033]
MRIGKSKLRFRFLIFLALFIVTVVVINVVSKYADQTSFAVSTVKTEINGKLSLKIGSLKGTYTVDDFSVADAGPVNIPYEASSEEGTFILKVSHDNETVWEKTVTSPENGSIEYKAIKERYKITVETESAKKLVVKLSR